MRTSRSSPRTSPTPRRRPGCRARDRSPTSARSGCSASTTLQGETLAALDELPPDAGDPTLRAALAERLERERLLFDTGFTPRLVAGLATPVHLIRYAIEGLTVTPDAAGDELVARLEAVPHGVAQYIDALRWSRDNDDRFTGTGVAPVRQLDTLAEQVELVDRRRLVRLACRSTTGWMPRTRARVRAAADRANVALARTRRGAAGRAAAGRPDDRRRRRGRSTPTSPRRCSAPASISPTPTPTGGRSSSGSSPRRRAGRGAWAAPATTRSALGGRHPRRRPALSPRRRPRDPGVARARVAETTDALAGAAFDLPPGIRGVDCVVAEASAGVVYYTPAPPDGSVPSRIVWTIPSGVPVAATLAGGHERAPRGSAGPPPAVRRDRRRTRTCTRGSGTCATSTATPRAGRTTPSSSPTNSD